YTRLPATPIPAPYVVGFSSETAHLLGLPADIASSPEFADYFAGNLSRGLPRAALPIATVYSGHQFGVWAGQLGDGRALLLGEIEVPGGRSSGGPGETATGAAGEAPSGAYELQLKGAGLTPYSRMGDGRAV